jgi:hypothetical protein
MKTRMRQRLRTLRRCALLLGLIASDAGAEKLARFRETIRMDQNGGATVTWNFVCTHDSLREVNLPWNFSKKNDPSPAFAVRHGADGNGHAAALRTKEGVFFVQIRSDSLRSGKEWELSFNIPDFQKFEEQKLLQFGNRILKYRFSNTQLAEIADFSTEIILPDGYVVTSIDETVPKMTEESPESPTRLSTVGKNVSIVLKAPRLVLGEQAFMKLQCKSGTKSPLIGIGLLCIGILYLIFFRDLVRRPANLPETNGEFNGKGAGVR